MCIILILNVTLTLNVLALCALLVSHIAGAECLLLCSAQGHTKFFKGRIENSQECLRVAHTSDTQRTCTLGQ